MSQLTCFRGFSIGNFIFFPRFLFSFFFFFNQILRNQLWVGAKFCKITKISSLTSSVHHEFVNVGVNWAINASKNRIVCLSRAPSFFSLRLAWTCGVSPHTETYEPVTELRHSTPHLTHKRTQTHTQVLRFRNAAWVRPNFAALRIQKNRGRTRSSHRYPKRTTPPAIPSNYPKWITSQYQLLRFPLKNWIKPYLLLCFSPNKGVSLFSHRLVTGEQAHGAGRYNQRCTPNQQQTWGITSFTCMRKSALFMNKLLLLGAPLSQMIMLSWRWPLQAVAAATIWLQVVYFIILQSI